jgi:hypothetical protein
MADRAYLYSDDRPDAWNAPKELYYDSRGALPLAWLFFFKAGDVGLMNFEHGGSQWQEVRLSTEKDSALALFELRKPLLISVIGHRVSAGAVTRFITMVSRRSGRCLLLHPDEVLGGINCGFDEDRGHAERIADILAVLGDGYCTAEVIRAITGSYVKELSPDPDQCEGQMRGCTSW